MRFIAVGLTLAAALLPLLLVPSTRADGAWLDQRPPQQWNRPRMAVPAAPAVDLSFVDPRCLDDLRPPESDEDEEVVRAGWMLAGAVTSGWGVRVVTGASGFDGMCRWMGYQQFIFVDGLFAGTTSPVPMDSRSDGAGGVANLSAGGRLFVSFARYAPMDGLCCPSRTSFATYAVERSAGAPVLRLTDVSTSANRPAE